MQILYGSGKPFKQFAGPRKCVALFIAFVEVSLGLRAFLKEGSEFFVAKDEFKLAGYGAIFEIRIKNRTLSHGIIQSSLFIKIIFLSDIGLSTV